VFSFSGVGVENGALKADNSYFYSPKREKREAKKKKLKNEKTG
jgi:hypothetical protein